MRLLTPIALASLLACRAAAPPRPPETPPAASQASTASPAGPAPSAADPFYVRDWTRVPVGFRSCRFQQTHKLADCLLEFAPSASAHADGVLFADETTPVVIHLVHGDRFHLHLLHDDGRDEVLLPGADGEIELLPAGGWPSRIVLATSAFFLDGGGRRLFVPPYTVTYRIEPLAHMEAALAVQEFAVHLADEDGARPHTVIASLPRNAGEFTFGYYNLTRDRRNALTNAYLCAPGHVIPEPTYRASVRTPSGLVFQKVEVLPYAPGLAPAPQGAESFTFEQDGREVDRVPVPPRPVLSHPDTSRQPLPFVHVAASFYGFSSGRYDLTTAFGFPTEEEQTSITVDTRSIDRATRSVTTTISPDRNERDEPVERTAFYGLRLSREWAVRGGCLPPPDLRIPGRGDHEHTIYIASERLPHVTMFTLSGEPSPSDAAFGGLGRAALNDAAVLAAIGGAPIAGAMLLPEGEGTSDRVQVTVINNHGAGGILPGGGGMAGYGSEDPSDLAGRNGRRMFPGPQAKPGPTPPTYPQDLGWQSRLNLPGPMMVGRRW